MRDLVLNVVLATLILALGPPGYRAVLFGRFRGVGSRYPLKHCMDDHGKQASPGQDFMNDCNQCVCKKGGHATCHHRLTYDLCMSSIGFQIPVSNFLATEPRPAKEKDSKACRQPKRVGPCRARHSRWYFNTRTQACTEFDYGGCRGNQNNFWSREACEKTCLATGSPDSLTAP